MKKLINLIFIFFFILLIGANAITQPKVFYQDSRPLALGGSFTAIADDINALFYNPAGLAHWGKKKVSLARAYFVDPSAWKPRYDNIGKLTFLGINSRFNTGLFSQKKQEAIATLFELGIIPENINDVNRAIDIGNSFFNQNAFLKMFDVLYIDSLQTNAAHYGWGNLTYDQLKELNQAIQDLSETALSSSVDMDILSYVRHYFAFGFFTSMDTSMIFGMQGLIPDIKLDSKLDTIFATGFGMPVPNFKRLSVGTTLKYFNRFLVHTDNIDDYIEFTGIDFTTFFDGIDYKKDWFDLALHGPTFAQDLPGTVYMGTGMGFDLGFMYQLKRNINLGLQLSDVYTKIRWWDNKPNSLIPMNARAGITYKPDFEIWGLFQDPLLAFDVNDLFWIENKSFWLKTHFGAEFKFLFKLITIRLGLNQGYPTFGAGLDFSSYWLSRIPLIGWIRPDSIYFPQFNPNKKDFLQHNPCCGLLSTILSPFLYAHIKFDVLYYTRELGNYVGAIADPQFSFRFSLSYSY